MEGPRQAARGTARRPCRERLAGDTQVFGPGVCGVWIDASALVLRLFCNISAGPMAEEESLYILLLPPPRGEIPHRLPGFVLFSLDPRCWLHGGIIKDGGRRLIDRLDGCSRTDRSSSGGDLELSLASFSSFFSLTNVDDYDDVEIYDLANTIISKSTIVYFSPWTSAVIGQVGLMSCVILI